MKKQTTNISKFLNNLSNNQIIEQSSAKNIKGGTMSDPPPWGTVKSGVVSDPPPWGTVK